MMLIMIHLYLAAEKSCMSHINQNALYQRATKVFVLTHQQLITKECHFFLIKLVLFQFCCHDNHENFVIVFSICLNDCMESIKSSVLEITEILQVVSFLIMK